MIAGPVKKIHVESISSADGIFLGRPNQPYQLQPLIGEEYSMQPIRASENGILYLDIIQSLVTQVRLLLDYDYLISSDRYFRGIPVTLLLVEVSTFSPCSNGNTSKTGVCKSIVWFLKLQMGLESFESFLFDNIFP